MPSPTNPEEEGIADDPRNGGNASMPEQVKRPNPWRKMMMMIINKIINYCIVLAARTAAVSFFPKSSSRPAILIRI